ncbi:hypothetical protein [Sphingobium sp. SCG-1]|uniref:hypothetical protein n=1 Tax=Sphingobium sp. SCG-1 TaxID=2072936 RepID=UPI0011AB353F|nr:hypothetical protein [Sphingobium sp. SCG-1]
MNVIRLNNKRFIVRREFYFSERAENAQNYFAQRGTGGRFIPPTLRRVRSRPNSLIAHLSAATGRREMYWMTDLPPDLAAKYRALVPSIDFTDAAKDEAIQVIHRIMQAGISIAWGTDSAQLALKHQFSKASIRKSGCDSVTFPEQLENNSATRGRDNYGNGSEEYAP